MDELVAWLRAQLTEDEMVVADMDTVFGDVLGTRKRAEDELDAKRRIIDLAAHHARRAEEDRRDGRPSRAVETVAATLHAVLMDLALPYADRPGYRLEWLP